MIYVASVFLLTGIISCDENFETFDKSGIETSGIPSSVESISSDSLPGQIILHWNVPVDSNYFLLKVNYYDYLAEKEVYKVTSVYEDSLLIDNTRKKFGDYEFTFQTFSSDNTAGEAVSFNAKSGRAPITETITAKKIELTGDQLSTNNQEPSEGPVENLVDGDPNSFFHTRWSSPQIPMPQYFQIDLKEPIDDFQFYLINRPWSQQAPEIVEIQISNDGEEWETVETISSGLPSGGGAEYTSKIFRPGHTFTHFRYNCLKTFGSKNYFNLAEFELYDVDIQVYDPEL
jgi:hypothetical protein